jgi:hypothetical protein
MRFYHSLSSSIPMSHGSFFRLSSVHQVYENHIQYSRRSKSRNAVQNRGTHSLDLTSRNLWLSWKNWKTANLVCAWLKPIIFRSGTTKTDQSYLMWTVRYRPVSLLLCFPSVSNPVIILPIKHFYSKGIVIPTYLRFKRRVLDLKIPVWIVEMVAGAPFHLLNDVHRVFLFPFSDTPPKVQCR